MMRVRILADDLTGAMDAGACFASSTRGLPVHWRSNPSCTEESFVITTESRDIAQRTALTRLRAQVAAVANADIAFKKIDSLLRGNTIAEITECVRSFEFGSAIIAPAFPAQQRMTRGGQQFHRSPESPDWAPIGPNLVTALAMLSCKFGPIPVKHVARICSPSGKGIFVCDAETNADLLNLAASGRAVDQPILWCGSAGLARALSPQEHRLSPSGPSLLILTASRNRMARLQIAEVQRRWPTAVVEATIASQGDVVSLALENALAKPGIAVLVARYPDMPVPAADRYWKQLLDTSLACMQPPAVLMVVGGTTLRIVLEAVGAETIVVEGEVAHGIAAGRIVGGLWNGISLITKAGAFGVPETLASLIDEAFVGEAA